MTIPPPKNYSGVKIYEMWPLFTGHITSAFFMGGCVEYSPLAFLNPVLTIFHPALCPQRLDNVGHGFSSSALWLVGFGIRAHHWETRGREKSVFRTFISSVAFLQSFCELEPRATISTQLSFSLSVFFL